MAFDQAAVAIQLLNGDHLRQRKRLANHAEQITEDIAWIGRKRDWSLPALYGPLDAHRRRMDPMAFGNVDDEWIFAGRSVRKGAVALGPARPGDPMGE